MTSTRSGLPLGLAAAALLGAGAEAGARLSPASPQPAASELEPGLAVRYAFAEVRDLGGARAALLAGSETGKPLVGLDYPDGGRGAPALSSDKSERVVAEITGLIFFESAGTWRLQVWSNDGVSLSLGGQQTYVYDGRHPCETLGWEEVEIPEPGWYDLKVFWFQRLSSSCLMMKWVSPDGKEELTPTDVYGYVPQ